MAEVALPVKPRCSRPIRAAIRTDIRTAIRTAARTAARTATRAALRAAWVAAGCALLCAGPPASGSAPSEDLPRRPFLGLSLAPLTEEGRRSESYSGEEGYLVQALLPASGAAAADLPVPCILLRIGSRPVGAPGSVTNAMTRYASGDTVHLALWRKGALLHRTVTLTPMPRETSSEFQVEYGVVGSDGRRFRTIVTRPPEGGRRPALLLIQGLGCFSIDGSAGPAGGMSELGRSNSRSDPRRQAAGSD